jgi:hypothetical protein
MQLLLLPTSLSLIFEHAKDVRDERGEGKRGEGEKVALHRLPTVPAT